MYGKHRLLPDDRQRRKRREHNDGFVEVALVSDARGWRGRVAELHEVGLFERDDVRDDGRRGELRRGAEVGRNLFTGDAADIRPPACSSTTRCPGGWRPTRTRAMRRHRQETVSTGQVAEGTAAAVVVSGVIVGALLAVLKV